jgi:GT2 family glycosyltransferase
VVDISFIIVNWNTKDILSQCLKSLYENGSSYHSEIIVVDNASTDGSVDLVREKFPEVIVIQNDANFGFAKANNIGFRRSLGRYICFINSDIMVLENCINSLVEFIDRNPIIGILSPRLLRPDLSLNSNCRKFPTLWNNLTAVIGLHKIFPKSSFFSTVEMSYFNHDDIREVEVVAGSFWLVRRKAMEQVGLLDEDYFFYAEDMDWCKRFWSLGWKVIFYPEAKAIHYHGGSSSKMPVKFYIQQHRAGLHYWEKYNSNIKVKFIKTIWFLKEIRKLIISIILYPISRHQHKDKEMKDDIRCHLKCAMWLLNIPIREQ